MATQYMENQGFKKKYLAPLIVLMLCAVSLTGAAYAYSTSITGNGTINHDYYSIDMYDKNGTVISTNIVADKAFDVMTDKKVGESYTASVNETEITITTYIKVLSNKNEACKISPSAGYMKGAEGATASMYEGWTSETIKIFTYTIQDMDTENSSAVALNDDYVGATNHMYKVVITFTLPKIDKVSLGVNQPSGIPNAIVFADYISMTFTATEATSSS